MFPKSLGQDQKQTVLMMIAIGVFLLMSFAHMMSWGRHSFRILGLKAIYYTGLASADQYKTLAVVCAESGKYVCAEKAYLHLYESTRDPEVVGQLAELQVRAQNYKLATQTYVKYYQLEGKNPNHAYFYGQALEKSGEPERAIRAYQLSIQQNPEKLSLNATSSLIRLLMTQQRYAEAQETLNEFYDGSDNAKAYLHDEAKKLKTLRAVASTPEQATIEF